MKYHLFQLLLTDQLYFLLFALLLTLLPLRFSLIKEDIMNDLMLKLSSKSFQPLIRITVPLTQKILLQSTPLLQKHLQWSVLKINRKNMRQLYKSLSSQQRVNLTSQWFQPILPKIKILDLYKLSTHVLLYPLVWPTYQKFVLKHLDIQISIVI